MAGSIRTARSWATVTFDTVAVFAATAVLLFPVTTALGDAIGLPSGGVRVIVGIVAFGAAYPFVAGDWSTGRLGEYFFAFVVATLAVLGFVGALSISGSIGLPLADPMVRVALWCVISLTAYLAVASGTTQHVLS